MTINLCMRESLRYPMRPSRVATETEYTPPYFVDVWKVKHSTEHGRRRVGCLRQATNRNSLKVGKRMAFIVRTLTCHSTTPSSHESFTQHRLATLCCAFAVHEFRRAELRRIVVQVYGHRSMAEWKLPSAQEAARKSVWSCLISYMRRKLSVHPGMVKGPGFKR